jgi:hypothetical protein
MEITAKCMYIMSLDGELIFMMTNASEKTKFIPDYIFRTAILRLVQNSHHQVSSIKYQKLDYIIIATKSQIIVLGFEIDSVHIGYIILQLKKIISRMYVENQIIIETGSISTIQTTCIEIISDILKKIRQAFSVDFFNQLDDYSISSALQV